VVKDKCLIKTIVIMKFRLNARDRLIIVTEILPRNGSRMEMIAAEEIEETIRVGTEEFAEYGIREQEGRLMWDPEKSLGEKEFDLKKVHTDLLKRRVKEMDEKKMWNRGNVKTCLKIEEMR